MKIEGFYIRTINLNGHGLLDNVHANDQTVSLFFRYEETLSSSEQAALDAYPHAFYEVGMWATGKAVFHHRLYCSNLLIRYWYWSTIQAYNTYHTDSFQHGDSILQGKMAKEIPPEQRNINKLDAILPNTALLPQRQ